MEHLLETAAGHEAIEQTAAEDRGEFLKMCGRFVEIPHDLKSSRRSQVARAMCILNQ